MQKNKDQSQKTELKIGHINVQSMLSKDGNGLLSKLAKIKLLVAQYDIFAVSESWLNGSNMAKLQNKIEVDGYRIIVNSRRCPDCKCQRLARGGGIVVYVKENLTNKLVTTIYNQKGKYKAFQYIHLVVNMIDGIKYPNGPLHVIAMYNPKGKKKVLVKRLERLPRQYQVVALGDTNINANVFYDHETAKIKLGYSQLIQTPTRENSVIDHIYVTREDLVRESMAIPVNNIADHHLISCTLRLSQTEHRDLLISGVPDKYEYQNMDILKVRLTKLGADQSKIVKIFRINSKQVYVRFNSQNDRDQFYGQLRQMIESNAPYALTASHVFGDCDVRYANAVISVDIIKYL